MDKLLILIALFLFSITQAQIVTIPDANFKNALVNTLCVDTNNDGVFDDDADTNNDGEIQVTEAESVNNLRVSSRNILDLTGIASFTNLTILNCSLNQLTNLDLSNNIQLTKIDCFANQLETLDIGVNSNLTELLCFSNQLTILDVSNFVNLTKLLCSNNLLVGLDTNNNTSLTLLSCSSNLLTSLDLSNNNITSLRCENNQLTTLDLSNNINLASLYSSDNQLTSLNISDNVNLTLVECAGNQLTNIDLSSNINLDTLRCSYNILTSLNLSNNINLTRLYCSDNQLAILDLSNNHILTELYIRNNNDLNYVNLKNGNNENIDYINFEYLPVLEYICVDDVNLDLTTNIANQVGHPVTFTEFCSFSPSLSNEITGDVLFDVDANGCNASDLPMPSLMVITTNGTESFATFTQSNGDYLLFTNEGVFSTLITTNLPNYFTINPNTHINTFVGFENTFVADFCIEPNQTINDVSITLLPTSQARPGFEARYQIVYKNIGTTQLSGDIILEFDDASLSFLSASETVDSQTSNSLTFNYSNLNQFESRTINLEFNVFAPPIVEIDDVLTFTATINPFAGDNTPEDNIFNLNQTVVDSYDPNDITCLEGNQVLIEDVDEYLHYIIRFQNMGTASAINVVVTNVLDDNLDWSTIELESVSHSNRVAITNGNDIDFIFENINLPDSNTNEPDSHGFIAYKIKPKTSIQVGDIISNTADIFFDFNEAISTNIETTEIIDPDTISPVANCQNYTVFLDANGNASISANDIDNGSTDNVGIVNMSVSPNAFNCVDIGNVTVTLTVEDAAGNTDSCTATVTVEDTIAPTVIGQLATGNLNGTGTVTIPLASVDNGSFDNCNVSLTLTPDTFTAIGTYTSVLEGIDSSGNSNSVNVTITIIDTIDTIDPIAVCQDIVIQLDVNGNVLINGNDIDGGSSDNIAIAFLEATPNSFDCTNIGVNTVELLVTDTSGNTDTCEAFVTVEDTLNPVAIGMNIEIDLNGNPSISITPEDIDDGSNDNCTITSMTLSQDTFTNIGTFNVDLTVTDSSGNSDITTILVTVIDSSLGVITEEIAGFKIYPNPTRSIINIEINGQLDNIKIYDITGRIVKEIKSIGLNSISIPLYGLYSGIYFVYVTDENGRIAQKRLIKQ